MEWLAHNWIWVPLIGGLAAMNSFDRGGGASRSRHRGQKPSDDDHADRLAGA